MESYRNFLKSFVGFTRDLLQNVVVFPSIVWPRSNGRGFQGLSGIRMSLHVIIVRRLKRRLSQYPESESRKFKHACCGSR